jgi:hypothetical protein
MKAAVVSFSRGAGWLGDGWRMFRAAPLAWLAFVALYVMLMALLANVVPKIGSALGLALVPAFSVGFMTISRSCARKQAPPMGDLFAGFRGRVSAQLYLGAAYVLLVAAAVWATTLADDGVLARWFLAGEKPAIESIRSPEFRSALLIFAAALTPVITLFWFAPALVAWHGMGVAKAMFFSFAACLVNWRSFTGYGIAGAVILLGVPFVVAGILLMLFGIQAGAPLADRLMPIVVLMLAPVLFGSFYASYRDVFGTSAGNDGGPPPEAPAQ